MTSQKGVIFFVHFFHYKKSASALLNLAGHWKTDEEAVAAAGGLK